ncbi:MAG TPA: uroporphyrinogen-III C-methyltransferase [Actinomycetota bacterium]|nr:uroporphyrinogen-III C-methyltransferase [Actinomycetota bacterium]
MTGTVFLVGAGPGDPGLLTRRGAELLERADVVVYDRLVSGRVLDLAAPWAERIYAGKAPGEAALDQQDINAVLVAEARQGKVVVRLKGGDPFVFGRGGEEALACAEAGVPFEVVPGVSSAVAAPAFAGIPVTHRGVASSFAVVTATGSAGRTIDLGPVARGADTLIVLMAAGRLDEVCGHLIAGGRAADEPAAVVESATGERQRVVTGRLDDLAAKASRARIRPPATLIVGAVVALRDHLAWFEPSSRTETEGAGIRAGPPD